jgi:hypothetical protein
MLPTANVEHPEDFNVGDHSDVRIRSVTDESSIDNAAHHRRRRGVDSLSTLADASRPGAAGL